MPQLILKKFKKSKISCEIFQNWKDTYRKIAKLLFHKYYPFLTHHSSTTFILPPLKLELVTSGLPVLCLIHSATVSFLLKLVFYNSIELQKSIQLYDVVLTDNYCKFNTLVHKFNTLILVIEFLIKSRIFAYTRLVNKSYENRVIWEGKTNPKNRALWTTLCYQKTLTPNF